MSYRTWGIGGSGDSKCAELKTPNGKLFVTSLAITAICLVGTLVTLLTWHSRKRSNPALHAVLPWHSYGLVLLLYILVLCINITRLPLEMCRAASATEFLKVGLAQNILASITHLLLLAVVAFSLVRHFRKQNSCSAKMPTLISGILFSLTALLWLPVVVLSGYLKTQTINQLKMNVWFNSERREKLAILENTETKIEVGYQAMCVATYFAAAIFSLRALKLSTAPKVQLWTALTFVALIIMPLCIFIIRVGWTIPGERMHYTSSIVFIVFEDLSLTFALFGIVKSVYNSTVASSGTDINPTGNLNSTKQGVNWPSF